MPETAADITIKAKMGPEDLKIIAKAMESAHRRDLVGGLIRYLKDGEQDFANLLFHYVHVDDYGQAMIEGWGELHKLITEPSKTIGPFGLSYARFDFWEQAVMSTVYERAEETMEPGEEEATRNRIIDAAIRVRAYRGTDLLPELERQEIDLMVIGFAATAGLGDLIAEPEEEDDTEEEFSYEEDDEDAENKEV